MTVAPELPNGRKAVEVDDSENQKINYREIIRKEYDKIEKENRDGNQALSC